MRQCSCPRQRGSTINPRLFRVVVKDPPLSHGCSVACMHPDTYLVEVDKSIWRTLTDDQKAVILAHEVSHDTGCAARCEHDGRDGRPCEHCADRYAGAVLRRLGMPVARAARAAKELAPLNGRPLSFVSVMEGYAL